MERFNEIQLDKDLAYTDILGFYEAVYKRCHCGNPSPDDYVFEPSKVYCSKDIFERVNEYYRQELGWNRDDDFSFCMNWCNSGPKAIDNLINYTVIVSDNWCHPREDNELEDHTSVEGRRLLEKLFPGKSELYDAEKADIGYYIWDIDTGEDYYYYMEDEYGIGQFYLNSYKFNHDSDGVAYAIPATPKEDCLYSYEEIIDYSFDDIYEKFKDYIDEDWHFVDALIDVLIGQSLDEVEEELKDKTIYEYQKYISERFR